MPLRSPQGGVFVLSYSNAGSESGSSEIKDGKGSPGRFKRQIGGIRPHALLIAVTFLALFIVVGFLWSPMESSVTKLNDSSVYEGVVLTSLIVAYLALALRRAHQYASRLALIGLVGLIVLVVGWALRSV